MWLWDFLEKGENFVGTYFDENSPKHLFVLFLTFWILVTSIAFAKAHKHHLVKSDVIQYAKVALNLVENGIFSEERTEGKLPTPQRFFVPAYPTFLAGLLLISPTYKSYVECAISKNKKKPCDISIAPITIVQSMLWALIPVLTFLMGRQLGLTMGASLAAAVLVVLATRGFARFPVQMLTESLAIPLSTLACYLIMRTISTVKLWQALTIGVLLGVLTLTRPIFFYASPLILICLLFLHLYFCKEPRVKSVQFISIAFVSWSIIVGIWLIRNGIIFGDFALTERYGAIQFAKRVAYNDITWTEFFASLILYVPNWGGRVPTEALFPIEDFYRIIRTYPGAFYPYGGREIYRETTALLGRPPEVGDLVRLYVFPNISGHLLSTAALAWQGIFVRHSIGLAGVIALPFWIFRVLRHVRGDQLGKWLAVLLLPTVLFGLHALASVSISRYNIALAPLFALITISAFMSFKPKEVNDTPGS